MRALLAPRWAQKLVRLEPDAQGGGFAEFRATYGGLFLGLHGAALYFALTWIVFGGALIGVLATGACAVIASAWGGAAFGRALSIWRDGAATRFNLFSALFEAVLAIIIAAPWFVWSVARELAAEKHNGPRVDAYAARPGRPLILIVGRWLRNR